MNLSTRIVSTPFGVARQFGSVDGVGSNARCGLPFGVALNAAGTLALVVRAQRDVLHASSEVAYRPFLPQTDAYTCLLRRIDLQTSGVSTMLGGRPFPASWTARARRRHSVFRLPLPWMRLGWSLLW